MNRPAGEDLDALGHRRWFSGGRRGLLLRASHWMVALAPPLTISAKETDELLDLFEASLADVVAGNA